MTRPTAYEDNPRDKTATSGGGMGKSPGTFNRGTSIGTKGASGGRPNGASFDPNSRAPKAFAGEKEPKVKARTRSQKGRGGGPSFKDQEGPRGHAVEGIKNFGDFEMRHTSKTR